MFLFSLTTNDSLLSSAQAHGLLTQMWFVILTCVILNNDEWGTLEFIFLFCVFFFFPLEKDASAVFLLWSTTSLMAVIKSLVLHSPLTKSLLPDSAGRFAADLVCLKQVTYFSYQHHHSTKALFGRCLTLDHEMVLQPPCLKTQQTAVLSVTLLRARLPCNSTKLMQSKGNNFF